MLTFRKPTPRAIRQFLEAQRGADVSYAAVGATASDPPAGYVVDHTREKLGSGEQVFRAAKAALEQWEHFQLGWVAKWPHQQGFQQGEEVAVLAHAVGLWWLNACRIVYLVDERNAAPCRFGFAYGTLAAHAESGEERFLVEWDPADDSVWYDILAFSRPRHPLARLAYPLARKLQRRFARDSVAAMQRAVSSVRH